jgi:hypothetical protein
VVQFANEKRHRDSPIKTNAGMPWLTCVDTLRKVKRPRDFETHPKEVSLAFKKKKD